MAEKENKQENIKKISDLLVGGQLSQYREKISAC